MAVRRRAIAAVLALAALGAGSAAGAGAHSGGRAIPVAEVRVTESGPLEALVDVRLRDEDGGEPIRGAVVKGFALMTRPHTMTTYFDALPEVGAGRYRGRVKLPMTARWTLELQIGGPEVVKRTVRAPVVIERSALSGRLVAPAAKPGKVELAPAPVVAGTVRFEVSSRDLGAIAVLWAHGLAAIGWVVGIAALLVAATAGSGWLAPRARARLATAMPRVGLPLVWGAAAVVVGTGVYNTLRLTPFEVPWTPDGLADLDAVPYGVWYVGVLYAKLVLFAVMLASGLFLTRRARRRWAEPAAAGVTGALVGRLGPSGLVFVLAAPAIVAAAVALRYLHILAHVAEATGS